MRRETTAAADDVGRYIDKCKSHRRNNVPGIQDKKPINGRRGAVDLRDFFFFFYRPKPISCGWRFRDFYLFALCYPPLHNLFNLH